MLAGTGSNVNRLAYVKTVVPENQMIQPYSEEYDSEAYSVSFVVLLLLFDCCFVFFERFLIDVL